MHRGMPAGTRAEVPAEAPEESRGEPAAHPVRSGAMPTVIDGFIPRPETAPGLGAALVPGTAVALVPGRPAPAGPRDWLGTCGKTQLAAGFAESLWQSRRVDLLVWVVATSRAAVLSGYMEAAAAAMGSDPTGDAEAVAARFVGWLHEIRLPWLLVLDGLSDAADLAGLWPEGPSGMVLITAADAATVSGEHRALVLPVGVYSPRESLSYLMGRLTADPDQRLGAIDLVQDLGCEPLALSQASGVIASSALSCRDYRDYYVRRREQLTDSAGTEPPAGAVTWTFSVEQADRLSPGGGVQSVLAVAALLDGHAIPGAVFTASATRSYLAGDGPDNPAERDRIRGTLLAAQRTGLLTIDLADTLPTIRINPVLQAAIRHAMPDGMLDRAGRAAANALLEVWPEDEPQAWLAEDLRSCVVRLQRNTGDLLWAGGCHQLLLTAGRSLDRAGLASPAVTFWRDLAGTSDRLLGSDHPDTLVIGEHLASAYLTAGRATEAIPWCQWVLAKRAQKLGADHPGTMMARRDLGHALTAAGQLDDAITVLAGAADDYERVRGADHPDTLGVRDDLADAYRGAGQYDDAIVLCRRTLADRDRTQGPQHPDTTRTRQQLADAYLAGGRIKDAISQYKRVLTDRERSLGPDHLDTIAARGNLASVYHAAGRMASALQLYEQTRAGYARVLGADHPGALARSADLAHAYYTAGRLTDATTLLRDTVARCERVLPPGDPLTQTVRDSLANIAGE
jgi:tetratricopeptide (TPR) repeat protein